jgi:lipoprotein-anchoring transpeptidase ErfK/SrfK
MTSAEIGRRQFLAGGLTLVALSMAGCASIASSSIIDSNADLKSSAEPRNAPPHVREMYAAAMGEPFPVRASRIELVPERYWRQDVEDPTGEAPGTVFVDTRARFLYHVKEGGIATRYGVGIGRAGFGWSGKAHIAYKREWPKWTPPSDMIAREPELEKYRHGMAPGSDNPLGPRTLYIHQGNTDTLYRIHGNPDERTVGQAVSSGCVRLLPQDIIQLYNEVRSGSALLVV